MTKKYHIIIIVLLLALGVVTFYLFQQKNDKQGLAEKNSELVERVTELESNVKNLEDKFETSCQFTQTFNLIDFLDYQGETEEVKYILVDRFQNNDPVVLKVDGITNMEKGKFYEIKFRGNKYADISSFKYHIESITLTDKVGLEQVQESCK